MKAIAVLSMLLIITTAGPIACSQGTTTHAADDRFDDYSGQMESGAVGPNGPKGDGGHHAEQTKAPE